MIRLTRLRSSNPLYVNPDHIERLEQFHETTVHLFNGDEYLVTESAEEIVELITQQRARILAVASRLASDARRAAAEPSDGVAPTGDVSAIAELAGIADSGTGSVSSVVALLPEHEPERKS